MRRIALTAVLLVVSAGCGEREAPKTVSGSDLMTPIKAAAGPLRVSTTNPRYFETPAGEVVYLTGSYTWNALQDWGATNPPPVFSFNGYVDFLVAHGHNFTRLVSWEHGSGIPWTAEPVWVTPIAYERTGPDAGLDGQPKFDLTRWNEKHFDRLRSRIRQAERRGIYVSVVLFNGLSVGSHAWKGHPFNGRNNVNGVDADANRNGEGEELETLGSLAITEWQRAYLNKVIDSIGDLDNVLWEIGHEPRPNSKAWQQEMAQHIAAIERARGKVHPIVGEPLAVDTQQLWSGATESWVWRSFSSGLQPMLLDPYRMQMIDGHPVFRDPAAATNLLPPRDQSRPEWWSIRKSLGYTRWLASRMDLKRMTPRPELASTGYCLASPGHDYLIYLPPLEGVGRVTALFGLWRTVRVDLSGVGGTFTTEWFDPATASLRSGPQLLGGASRRLSSPFGNGGAVLRVQLLSL
jgi:hypothetical protein